VLENFKRGRPTSYTLQTAAPASLNDAIAQFTMENTGVFLQDTWTVNKPADRELRRPCRPDRRRQEPAAANTAVAQPVVAGAGQFGRQTGGFGLTTPDLRRHQAVPAALRLQLQVRHGAHDAVRGGAGLFQGARTERVDGEPVPERRYRYPHDHLLGLRRNPLPDRRRHLQPESGYPEVRHRRNPDRERRPAGSGLKQPSIWKANLAFEMNCRGMAWWPALKRCTSRTRTDLLPEPEPGRADRHRYRWPRTVLERRRRPAGTWNVGNNSVSTATGCTTTAKALFNLATTATC
jgi:hypothetical protein